jgi:hypothetical protein
MGTIGLVSQRRKLEKGASEGRIVGEMAKDECPMGERPVAMSIDGIEETNGKLKSRRIADFCAISDACHGLPIRN